MEEINNVTDPVEKEKAWEDLGRPETPLNATFRFVVTALSDGSLKTTVEEADEINRLYRTATTYDIYQSCKEISSDIDAMMLADRVAKTVLSVIKPQDSAKELKERLLSALGDRGIETPKA
jgi:hypothetical protein